MQYRSRNHSYTQIILRRVVLGNPRLTTRTIASEIDVNVFHEAVNDAREARLCYNFAAISSPRPSGTYMGIFFYHVMRTKIFALKRDNCETWSNIW